MKNTHSIQQTWIEQNSGKHPYVTASNLNNSIASYISYDETYLEKGKSIMIGGKTLVIIYQEEDYFSNDSHNLALYFKGNKNLSRECQLFLVTMLYKSLKPKYSWGDSISFRKIQTDTIQLPIRDGEIDFAFMQDFISAQEKLAIKGVIDWKDKVIATTKEIVAE